MLNLSSTDFSKTDLLEFITPIINRSGLSLSKLDISLNSDNNKNVYKLNTVVHRTGEANAIQVDCEGSSFINCMSNFVFSLKEELEETAYRYNKTADSLYSEFYASFKELKIKNNLTKS